MYPLESHLPSSFAFAAVSACVGVFAGICCPGMQIAFILISCFASCPVAGSIDVCDVGLPFLSASCIDISALHCTGFFVVHGFSVVCVLSINTSPSVLGSSFILKSILFCVLVSPVCFVYV